MKKLVCSSLLMLGLVTSGTFAFGGQKHCQSTSGSLITNFGVVDANTTLGPATGDLKGAVAATVLSITPNADGTVSFNVQHHWVTEAGDTINIDPATAITMPLSQTLFAIIKYPVHITGGTGKFAGATGDLTAIGEADLSAGTALRYSGKVCYAQ
jgi:hypothetical protein